MATPKSDIEIAQAATLRPVIELAKDRLGIERVSSVQILERGSGPLPRGVLRQDRAEANLQAGAGTILQGGRPPLLMPVQLKQCAIDRAELSTRRPAKDR